MALPNLPFKTGHLFIGLAVFMGILTMVLSGGGRDDRKETVPTAPAAVKTRTVVVPLVTVSQGKSLSMNDVKNVKWPTEFLPKGDVFEDVSDVVGRIARQDLFPGEPLFKEKLSGSNNGGGMPALIPNGLRAVTIAVTEVKGVGGFVKPGDRVDVLTTFEVDTPGETGQRSRITKTVLQNVLVLASAQTMVADNPYKIETPEGVKRGELSGSPSISGPDSKSGKDARDKTEQDRKESDKAAEKPSEILKDEGAKVVSSVTLAVTPAQAETMALADQSGEVILALRPETDHAIARLKGIQSEQLTGIHHPGKPTANASVSGKALPTPPGFPGGLGMQVEFIQGTEKTLYSF